ncbi:2-oxo acid dehydrogenase subunit E2 [Natronorubrum sp. FCH18a]|uniref:2-oxo acid dehydrogenase subunit E2 n=1 Tax=Natronorubrum sp. FCH18a TaxID=3447018 RepID=UPI003F5103F8
MVQAVRMPMMGNTMESGLLTEWKFDEGDDVATDDVVVVVESEKTSGEVQASQDGTLARVDVEEGESVPPGTVLGVVVGPDESVADAPAPRSRIDPESGSERSTGDDEPAVVEESDPATANETAGAPEDASKRAAPGARKLASEHGIDLEVIDGTGPDGAVLLADIEERLKATTDEGGDAAVPSGRSFASPSTRRLAREHGLSLDAIDGTGIGDRVTESDVRAAAGEVTRPTPTGANGTSTPAETDFQTTDADRVGVTVEEEQSLTGMRETIADRMARSAREAPHVTLNREVDVGRAFETAEELSREADADIGFADLLVGASVRALDAHPAFNAWFENRTIRRIAERNIAVAVDVNAGLVTPVIRTADQRTLAGIAAERRRLTDAVLDGEFTMDELQGGTFTISNLGMFGVDSFDPIINPPQIAILGVGRVRERDDGRTCTLSLSFDHRVVDGADAARFLDTLTAGLEAPSLVVADRSAADANVEEGARTTSETVDISETVAADIRATAREVADVHDWPVPSFEVRLTDGHPSVTVYAPDHASPATMKRLTYAACRESTYAEMITGIRDPTIEIA